MTAPRDCASGCGPRQALRRLAVFDGVALLLLVFFAVPLKHLFGESIGVEFLGPLHGTLFLLMTVMLLTSLARGLIRPMTAGLMLLAALVPFGAFYAAHRLQAEACEI